MSAERIREVLTPEGVPLHFRVATAGDRAAAFLIDLLLVALATVLLVLLATFALSGPGGGVPIAIALVGAFLLRAFYFMGFELRWRGLTPGKKRLGLRVIDRHGGALTTEAVVSRNLVRDLEVFLPLGALLAPEQLWDGAPGWAMLLALVWLLLCALLPLFNRDRLRVGDLVGGTIVVSAPRAVLLTDLAAAAQPAAGKEALFAFSPKQLDVYGIYELQVLEDVLRRDAARPNPGELSAIAERIRKKIDWQGEVRDTQRFLREFYAALRARNEQRLLFGKRKADKHHRDSHGP